MTALVNAAEFAVETGAWAKADELLADLQSRRGLPSRWQRPSAWTPHCSLLTAVTAQVHGRHGPGEPSTSDVSQPNPRRLVPTGRVGPAPDDGRPDRAFDEAIGAIDAEA